MRKQDRKENEILEANVKKIKLNENFGKITSNDEYELDPTEKV